jgi:addiction module HigA family antidote
MTPENALHPGVFLQFYLDELEVSQTALAERISCKPGKISDICRGAQGISAEMAIRIADALGTTPELWMNAQKNYELSQALKKAGPRGSVPPITGSGIA